MWDHHKCVYWSSISFYTEIFYTIIYVGHFWRTHSVNLYLPISIFLCFSKSISINLGIYLTFYLSIHLSTNISISSPTRLSQMHLPGGWEAVVVDSLVVDVVAILLHSLAAARNWCLVAKMGWPTYNLRDCDAVRLTEQIKAASCACAEFSEQFTFIDSCTIVHNMYITHLVRRCWQSYRICSGVQIALSESYCLLYCINITEGRTQKHVEGASHLTTRNYE